MQEPPFPYHTHTHLAHLQQQQQSVTIRQMKETGMVVLVEGGAVSQTPARFPPPRQLLVMPLILLGAGVVVAMMVELVVGSFTLCVV